MKQFHYAVVILIVFGCGVAIGQDQTSSSVLEAMAVNYMTAFNKGEFEEVVSLMHPEAVKNTKKLFIKEYEKALSEGRGAKFKNDLYVDKDVMELKKMEDSDVVVYILKLNRKMAIKSSPMASEKMKSVVVKAAGKEKIDDQGYRVKFIMTLPEDSNSIVRKGELIINRANGVWRVYK